MFGPAIFRVRDRKFTNPVTVLDTNDEEIDLASVKRLDTTLLGLIRRCRFKFIEYRNAMCGKERVRVQKVLDDEPLVFQLLLD